MKQWMPVHKCTYLPLFNEAIDVSAQVHLPSSVVGSHWLSDQHHIRQSHALHRNCTQHTPHLHTGQRHCLMLQLIMVHDYRRMCTCTATWPGDSSGG